MKWEESGQIEISATWKTKTSIFLNLSCNVKVGFCCIAVVFITEIVIQNWTSSNNAGMRITTMHWIDPGPNYVNENNENPNGAGKFMRRFTYYPRFYKQNRNPDWWNSISSNSIQCVHEISDRLMPRFLLASCMPEPVMACIMRLPRKLTKFVSYCTLDFGNFCPTDFPLDFTLSAWTLSHVVKLALGNHQISVSLPNINH